MIFGSISGLLWQICPLWLWLLLNVLMLISFAMFLRRPRVMAVGQLDQQLWSCHASDSAQPYSIVLERVIDHELYMILRTVPLAPHGDLARSGDAARLEVSETSGKVRLIV